MKAHTGKNGSIATTLIGAVGVVVARVSRTVVGTVMAASKTRISSERVTKATLCGL